MIQTVNGPVSKTSLGKTYIHEHLNFDLNHIRKDNDSVQKDVAIALDELKPAIEWGIKTFVDVSCINMGKDPLKLKEISDKANINVICATGFYLTEYYPEYVYTETAEQLAKRMIHECLVGIDGTDIKAGIIGEIATATNEFTENNKKVFKAAALTHIQTGLPVTTHPNMSTMAIEQAEFLIENGVKADKIIIGHMDLTDHVEYIEKVLKTGVNVGFDTIGKNVYLSEDKRLKTLVQLINKGYTKQIVLSEDISRKSYLASYGGIGYGYLVNDFLVKLKEFGVREDEIDQMLIDNPARILNVGE